MKSISLRTQLSGLMACLVLIQSLALLIALSVSDIYMKLDAEAFRMFTSATSTQIQNYNASTKKMANSAANDTLRLASVFSDIAAKNDTSESQVHLNDRLFEEASIKSGSILMEFMNNNVVSGAFIILESTHTHGNSSSDEGYHSHDAIYLRPIHDSEDPAFLAGYELEAGRPEIAEELGIAKSKSWTPDYAIADRDAHVAFYENPIQAAQNNSGARLESYGYWSSPLNMVGDAEKEILFTLPLIDEDGRPFGVFGLEISMHLFTGYYLSNDGIPYNDGMFAIIPTQENTDYIEWYIPGSENTTGIIPRDKKISLEKVENCEDDICTMYKTTIQGYGEMYCAIKSMNVYPDDSMFIDEGWSLMSMVPTDSLHETSRNIAFTLQVIIIVTTLLSFAIIYLMVRMNTRRIKGLSEYARNMVPSTDLKFAPTYIKEIDELTTALEKMNKNVLKASQTTSKILKLTLLPIGGFEIDNETGQVVMTEYVYKLLSIDPSRPIYLDEWEWLYKRLIHKPIPEYEDIYWFEPAPGKNQWLRIIEANSDTGTIGVILDVTKDVEEHRRLAHELDYDALTHLLNRVAIKRKTHLAIQEQPDKVGAMIFSDLDNLKYINDTFGHDIGDKLLVRAGEIFSWFKQHGGLVGRISGDEFAIYLHGFDSKEQIRDIVFKHFSNRDSYTLFTPDGNEQRIRYSTGIAYYPEDSDNETDLLKLADFAMYEAKHSSKGSINEFNKESYKSKAYLLENREAINRLLDEELIEFAFQPIVNMKTGEIFAYEALMRPQLENFKSPLEVLTCAAAQSKLKQLERLVILKAFRFASENKSVLGRKKIFMNSIPSEMVSDAELELVERLYSDVFDNIVIEITEEESDSAKLSKKVEFIRRNNMMMAIDDFGTGYSNELRIITIAPDIVKIDMELISNIDDEPDKQVLVSNIVNFCHRKGIEVVAEGVECYAEMEELSRIGVDYVQGFYIKRPKFDLEPIPTERRNEIRELHNRFHKKRASNSRG